MNMAIAVMEALPGQLKTRSYEALIQWYQVMAESEKIRWRVKCAVICEAWYRIKANTEYGEQTDALVQLADDFGIRKSSAYQKIKIWETFWQVPEEEKRVVVNDNHWKFEEMLNGIQWFRIALRAENPLGAIDEAQEDHDTALAEGNEYTSAQFSRGIQLQTTPEESRLVRIKQQIAKTAQAVEELSTAEDLSFDYVTELSEGLHESANKVDKIRNGVNDGTYVGIPASDNFDTLKMTEAESVGELTRLLEICELSSQTLFAEGNFKTSNLKMAISRISRATPSMVKTLKEAIIAENRASE